MHECRLGQCIQGGPIHLGQCHRRRQSPQFLRNPAVRSIARGLANGQEGSSAWEVAVDGGESDSGTSRQTLAGSVSIFSGR